MSRLGRHAGRQALLFRRFGADRRGGIAIMFALCVIPLFGIAGAAIDYARGTNARAKLDSALDSALLTGAQAALLKGADQVSADAVRAQWLQSASSISGLEEAQITISPTLVKDSRRYVVATYSAKLPTQTVRVLGYDTMQLGGRSEVTLQSPTYTDIYLVMDASASMGLAATDAGRQQLAQLTLKINGEECTFACHIKQAGQTMSNLEIAQGNGIQTRIDITQSAANSLLDDVKGAQAKNVFGAEVYRVGLYSFSGYGVDLGGAKTLSSPVSNTDLARSQVSALQLDNATAYKPMLREMTEIIGRSYDGKTPDLRRKYMIILTDGADYGHDWGQSKTIEPADCAALKQNGVGLYIFNTKWVADWGNWAFDPILGYKQNPFGGGTVFQALAGKLKECSSGDTFYYEGTDAAEIALNFRKIFRDIQNKSSFSQ